MADATFLFLTIDCLDPRKLAQFWSSLLDTGVGDEMDDGRFVFLEGRDDLPVICFQRVPEGKTVKNRLHLDLSVEDLAAATARVEEVGGSWGGAERTLQSFTWRTVADPEGNEFEHRDRLRPTACEVARPVVRADDATKRNGGGSAMRRACVILVAVLLTAAHPAWAGVLIEPTRVLGGPGLQIAGHRSQGLLAYSEVAGSTGPFAYIRNLETGNDKRINAAGTRAWTGGFNPGTDEVIFQQAEGPASDIYLYDYSASDRDPAPGNINTQRWEWDPRISNSYISFFRNVKINGKRYWGVYLYTEATGRIVRVAQYRQSSFGIGNGFVGEQYMTWTLCGDTCDAFVYDIESKDLRKIPDAQDRPRYGPVVDEANGVVFFIRSGFGCGVNVDFWSVPVATLGATPTRIASLPDNVDAGAQVSIQPNETEPTRDLMFERITCDGRVDLYALESVSAAP